MSLVAVAATFVAASVEWVEALTIVLAVGVSRGWRSALTGALGGLAALSALVLLVLALGGGLLHRVPLDLARALVGVFLLLFGVRWIHTAILRSSGLKALHSEDEAFESARARLAGPGTRDWAAVATAFNGTFLEGLEVVFIVVALAGLNGLAPAALGAVASLVLVGGAGVLVRRPLARVPENAAKYVVGVMLSAFGTFFAGEGIGVRWWHGELGLLLLIAGYGLSSLAIVWLLKRPRAMAAPGALSPLLAAWRELWGLFVGEGRLALATLAALLGAGLFVARTDHQQLGGLLLGAAVVVALLLGLSDRFGARR